MFVKNYKMNERGQIAIFVVIAIVLVATILGFVFLEKDVTEEQITQEEKKAASVDIEVMPVYNFVQECLEKYSVEGTNILGARGGYIYLPENVETNKFFNDEFNVLINVYYISWYND